MKSLRRFQLMFIFTFWVYVANAQNGEVYLMPAEKNDKWGFMDLQGTWVVPAQYEELYHFTEGLAAAKINGEWGYINNGGEWAIRPGYSNAKPFSEGLACVVQNGKWGFIDKKGDWAFRPRYNIVSSFSEGTALVSEQSGFYFIDKNGSQAIDKVYEMALPFSEGLASVQYNGQNGYIDHYGNWVIRHNFKEAYSFSQGLALIKAGDKYGYIDVAGHVAIGAIYEDANHFKDDRAAVKLKDNWGYINLDGEIVIQPRFTKAFAFSSGYAVVKSTYKYGLIDSKGDWVLNPTYNAFGRYHVTNSYEGLIVSQVQETYRKWQMKGEFEKSSDYLARVSNENRQKITDSITVEVINALAKRHVKIDGARLGLYNADIECFNLYVPGAMKIMFPVPIEEAPEFKNEWKNVRFGNTLYMVQGNNFFITNLEVHLHGKTYQYDIHRDSYANSTDIPLVQIQPTVVEIPDMAPYYPGSHMPAKSRKLALIGQSDVDTEIPETTYTNDKTFVLIVGNQDYSSFQLDLSTEEDVDFAEIDAKMVKAYFNKTLGVPNGNINLLINATAGQMRQALARLGAIARAYDGEAKLVFYYAGHGLPDEITHEPYLIPVDINGSNLSYAIKLEDVYAALTEYESKGVTVILDACFSGGGRNQPLMAARGVRIKPKSSLTNGKVVVFSASREEQTAHPYYEKAHGMFTYYFLKALQQSNGHIAFGELDEYVNTNVKRKSVTENNKIQEPVTKVSPELMDNWRTIRFISE